jgi:hypothetical protein
VNALLLLAQVAWADFLERSRRYSFLIVLGLAIVAGYLFVPPTDAAYVAGVLAYSSGTEGVYEYYRGLYNSAWIGGMVALVTTINLVLIGFYLTKNALARDRGTGVGQILAATPVGRLLYISAKVVSNLLVLAAMLAVVAAAALAMQFVRGEVAAVDPPALLAPFVWIGVPAMATVAALAVLFETISWLRGGFGNVVYFFLYTALMPFRPFMDLVGARLLVSSVQLTLRASFSDIADASIGVNFPDGPLHVFRWDGVAWTAEIVLGRLMWLVVAAGITGLAVLFFDRFDPARSSAPRGVSAGAGMWGRRGRQSRTSATESSLASLLRRLMPARAERPPQEDESGDSAWRETARPAPSTRFVRVLAAELRLMLTGHRWWWLATAVALSVAGLLEPVGASRQSVLPLAWMWPILVWSKMGARERRCGTDRIVFSTPHPLARHLYATWLAGVVVACLTGGGFAVRLALAGDLQRLLAWMGGALFIPSLAVALGCWTGGSKAFEVTYAALWYAGPINGVPSLDFMGATGAAVAGGVYLYYLIATAVLLAVAVLGRWRQMRS